MFVNLVASVVWCWQYFGSGSGSCKARCSTFVLPQSLKMVLREPLVAQPQESSSPLPQLVSMYHHLESVINTACYNLWTGLL